MNELRVRDLMTEDVVSVRPKDSVDKVYDAMAEKSIRHLAVIDEEGDLVGVVSHRDLLRNSLVERSDLPLSVQRELMRRMRVEEVMTSEVETAEPDQPLAEAAQVHAQAVEHDGVTDEALSWLQQLPLASQPARNRQDIRAPMLRGAPAAQRNLRAHRDRL